MEEYPDVDLPIVSVRTTLPGASPEEIESAVTRRIEDAVATVEGIDDIRSTSTESLSVVTITFGLNRNIDVAAQDVRDAVASAIAFLPRDAKPPLIRNSTPTLRRSSPSSSRVTGRRGNCTSLPNAV